MYLLVVRIEVLVLVYYVSRLDKYVLRHCMFFVCTACGVQCTYI